MCFPPLLKAAYPKIKAIDPSVVVLGGALDVPRRVGRGRAPASVPLPHLDRSSIDKTVNSAASRNLAVITLHEFRDEVGIDLRRSTIAFRSVPATKAP